MIDGIRVRQADIRAGQSEFDEFPDGQGGQDDGAQTMTVPAFHPIAFYSAGAAQIPLAQLQPRLRYRIFTQGAGSLLEQDQIGSHAGFESNVWSGSLGIERLMNPHLILGAALTLGENSVDAKDGTGGADIEGTVISLYSSYLKNGWFLDTRYHLGWLDVEIDRSTAFGQTARGSSSAFGQNVAVEGGRQFEVGKWVTGPVLGGKYLTGAIDGYTERGAGIFNLVVGQQNDASLESALGWQIARPFQATGNPMTLRFDAGWRHEFFDDPRGVDFTFETSPVSVLRGDQFVGEGDNVRGEFRTAEPGSDYLGVGAGMVGNIGRQGTLALGYQGQLLRDNFSEHYFAMQVGYRF